jgi:hypothetical protein
MGVVCRFLFLMGVGMGMEMGMIMVMGLEGPSLMLMREMDLEVVQAC